MRLVYVGKDLSVTDIRPDWCEVDEEKGTWKDREYPYNVGSVPGTIGLVCNCSNQLVGVFDADNLEHLEAMVLVSRHADEDERYRRIPGREASM